METGLIAIGSVVLYVLAYRTYGRYLARRIFRLDPDRVPPSEALEDGVDFVPSSRSMVFGHHFTSIAGTGPIVGPTVAVIWGWVPALVWVLVGSIVMGAVHDFGSLVVSMRHRGRTVADLAGTVVNARVRLLFLIVVVVGLWVVLAVFGLVIAAVFKAFPSSVAPVAAQIPIAIVLGLWIRRGGSLLLGTVAAVALMALSIWWSAGVDWSDPYGLGWGIVPDPVLAIMSAEVFWTLLLLAYVSVASVLPVHWLLQPRDHINTWQLLVVMGLVLAGLLVARPEIVADAVNTHPEPAASGARAPSFLPFLFVTIACGAISGFHCLVASGCSSRQLRSEADAQGIGFGAMLTEGFLAVLVILVCAAGIGLGTIGPDGATLMGVEAWNHHYGLWSPSALGLTLTTFVRGASNLVESVGIPPAIAQAMMGVFVASFAATTMDSACRLQRYVIAELAGASSDLPPRDLIRRVMRHRYVATFAAVLTASGLAFSDAFSAGWTSAGRSGLVLWPVFGATNQLLGGLALLVITVWLVRTGRPSWMSVAPMVFMLAMTGWAIAELIRGFAAQENWFLLGVSVLMLLLEIWIVVETALLVRRGLEPLDEERLTARARGA